MRWYGVGRGFRIGHSCTPVADSCQCMAKPIQYCKVKLRKKKKQMGVGWRMEGEKIGKNAAVCIMFNEFLF